MSDVAPADVQDQPTDQPEAPEPPDQPTNDQTDSFTEFNPTQIPDDADREWLAERYKQMQGDYSRKSMELGEGRREAERNAGIIQALLDPQQLPAILAQAGYDEKQILDLYGYQGEVDEEPGLEEEFRDPRVDELLSERQAEARQGEVTRYVESEIEAVAKERGSDVPQDERVALDFIGQGLSGQDVPDIQAANKFLEGVVDARVKAILDSKKAPRPPAGGKPGSRQVDLSKESDEGRVARMAQAAEEAQGSSVAA